GETGEAIGERLTSWLTGQEHSDEVLAHEIRTTFRERVVELECTLQDFARAVLEFALDALCSDPSCPDQTSIRLTTDVRERQSWQEVVRVWPAVERAIDELAEWLRRVVQTVLEGEERLDETLAILLLDIEQIQSRLAQLSRSLAIIGGNEHNRDYVCWMTASKNQSEETSWILRAAPLEVGPALRTALYQDAQTIVMTSATLTVEGSFDFIRQRLGLEEERNRLLEQTVASPFDFDHQLLLCVPSDLPLPTEAAFEPASHAAIVEVARAARGGTLCLFTSRESMLRAYEETANPLREAGLVPISQDHAASRTAALEALREDPSVVLFGVKSLWEGIDVPGEALRCLIVVKLPFAVPSDPLIQARQERMEEEGLNGYDAYYVPHAVIGFRQGIGRLIRTRTDRGAVFVLDRRILVRRYGARFLQSLPPGRVMRGSLRECVETARGFWGGETCS
ncbi:MAG: ATP-dependent DNA helicase, partial [Candidatus Zipacnadales bacterium]